MASIILAETSNAAPTAGVEHIDEVIVGGDTDRPAAAAGHAVEQGEPRRADGEHREVMTAGVDGEQHAAIGTEDERPLRAKAVAGALAAGGDVTGGGKPSVRRSLPDEDGVAGRVVGERIDCTRTWVWRLGGLGRTDRPPGDEGEHPQRSQYGQRS
jgi:hypothetical protein